MRSYSRIMLSVEGIKDSKLLEEMIPERHRPQFVFWHLTPGQRPIEIVIDGLVWHIYTGKNRKNRLYVLGISKDNETAFTHQEVLDFLRQYPPPPQVLVSPMSDMKELQDKLDENMVNDQPWDHDLPV